MAYYKQLFPPIVPANMNAYNGAASLNFYFKISLANNGSQFKHAQVIINRLDTNLNALNTVTYPLGMMFIKNVDIIGDRTGTMFYFSLPANLLPLDYYYKVQVRLGQQDITGVAINYSWLNDSTQVSQFSEWSNVCIIKPTIKPDFGLVGFTTGVEPVYSLTNPINIISTPSFTFVGYYTPMDANQEETLKNYQIKLYDYNTNTLLSDSGVLTQGDVGQTSIQYVFDYMMVKKVYYRIDFTTISKNGYTETKSYKTLCMFADSQIPNLLKTMVDSDNAKITVSIATKKLRFDPINKNSSAKFIADGPMPDGVFFNHAILTDLFAEIGDLDFYAVNGKWVVQMKAMGIVPNSTIQEARANPFLSFTETIEDNSAGTFYFIIKLSALKQKTSRIGDPDRWRNDFVLRKEMYDKNGKFLIAQEKIFSLAGPNGSMSGYQFINPMNEYYFYIKEADGNLEFYVEYLRTSTNSDMSNLNK